MTLQEFSYFFSNNEFARTFLTMVALYCILFIPSQKDIDLQLSVTRGIVLVFLFCCGWWAMGNYDIIFSALGLR